MSFSEKKFSKTYESLEGATPNELISLIEPKIEHAITIDSVKEQLEKGEPLNIKFGTDPTGPDLHIGHVVPIRVLDILSRAGHNIDLVFGDFTAKVGDPSGRSNERPLLTDEKISENVSTFRTQVNKYFDTTRSNVKVSHNSDWLKDMPFSEVFKYLQDVNLSEAMQRRDFRTRLLGGQGVSLAEAFYGTMMGIDSVQLETDIEIGGIDQLLNFQQTREVQRNRGQHAESVLMTPILEGTSGNGIKMSKSLGNFVPLRATPNEIYGKMMSIPDDLILKYMTAFAPVEQSELEGLSKQIADNPLEMKKQLATYMAAISTSELSKGLEERENFERRFVNKTLDEKDIQVLPSSVDSLIDGIFATGNYSSRGEIRRLALQGAIKIDGQKVSEEELLGALPESDTIVTVGKRSAYRIANENINI
ncbi:MAG: Tyrosine--tRNA ligase [Candidatus Saccharibacteria bacterium]|nr:Tyrosine--tRNA ligase [Candidatus Saccharibacteria bacterium]